jgi:predicted dehydrogenase
MGKIRIGIVGAGFAAGKHLEVFDALDRFEVAGITSRTRARAEALVAQRKKIMCYDTLGQMMAAKDRPQALLVAVTEDQMVVAGEQALSYGVPVFFEKPAGLTPEENLKLAEIAEKKNIPTMVGFNRRFFSVFHKGMDIIKQAGPLFGVAVEGHERIWKVWKSGKFSSDIMGDWIFANSTHTIDLLRFFGGDVKSIKALAARRKGEARGDQFASVLELESGAIGNYHAHWNSPGGWRVVLYGDGVTVEFKPLESGRWTDKTFEPHEIEPDEVDKKFKPGFYRQMVAFADLVETGKKAWPVQDLRGSYATMVLARDMTLPKA